MGAVKKEKAYNPPPMSEGDMYHLADILDTHTVMTGHHLWVSNERERKLNLKDFNFPTKPVSIDGTVSKEYAALRLYMGGDLYIWIVVFPSRTISQFTLLLISSETPPELLQSAFKMNSEPLPLRNFLDYMEGITMRGFHSNADKRWKELSEAARMDLFKRGRIDAGFSILLKI